MPWHILAPSAVACDIFLLRASAHPAERFLCHRPKFLWHKKHCQTDSAYLFCNWLPFNRPSSFASQTFVWFAISLITIFLFKVNCILHPYFFAHKKNVIALTPQNRLSFFRNLILFFGFCDIIRYYKNSHE